MRTKELQHAIVLEAEVRAHIDAETDLASAREAVRELVMQRVARTVPDDVDVEPLDEDGIRGEWVDTPFETEERIIVLVHGDAWSYGSAAESRELAARIARASQSRVLSLDHRLAPEHPFPSARDDVMAAWRLLIAEDQDPRKVAFVGISTGATLVLEALVALRAAGDPLPGAVALLSPVVDADASLGDDPLGSWATIQRFAPGYHPQDAASPSLAEADLTGLPSMLVHAGSDDPVLAQARGLVERARAAGIDVTYTEWDGMVHAWHRFVHVYDAGRGTNQVGDYMLQRIGPGHVPVPFEDAR